MRDYHGALLLLTSMVDEGVGFADVRNLLGLCLAMLNRPDEALIALDEALRMNPAYVEAHLNRAVVLNQLGREEEASQAMEQAGQFGAPDESGYPSVVANKLANSHAALGDAYREAGALGESIAQYRRALELRPRFADIRLALGRALLEHGEHRAAWEELEEVLRQRPNWLDAMLLQGLAAYLDGDLAEAKRVWEGASTRHPEEPRLEIYRNMLTRRGA